MNCVLLSCHRVLAVLHDVVPPAKGRPCVLPSLAAASREEARPISLSEWELQIREMPRVPRSEAQALPDDKGILGRKPVMVHRPHFRFVKVDVQTDLAHALTPSAHDSPGLVAYVPVERAAVVLAALEARDHHARALLAQRVGLHRRVRRNDSGSGQYYCRWGRDRAQRDPHLQRTRGSFGSLRAPCCSEARAEAPKARKQIATAAILCVGLEP